MKNRKILAIALAIIILTTIFIGIVALFKKTSDSNQDNSEIETPSETFIQKEYFVIGEKFKGYRESITKEELAGISLMALDSDIDALETFFPEKEIVQVEGTYDDLYRSIADSKTEILALLPFDKVNPKFRIVAFEGINLFDKQTKVDEYSLFTEEKLSEKPDERFIEISEGVYSNYDKKKLTTFFVGGDLNIGRGVDIKWLRLSNNNLRFLFDRVEPYINSADMAMLMLEHSYQGDPVPCSTCTSFVGDEATFPQIKDAGIDFLVMAGNHIGDGGLKAQERTMELVKQNDMLHAGAGANLEEASKPGIVEFAGVRYAIFSADEVATFYWAGDSRRGSNRFSKFVGPNKVIDTEKIQKDIADAKKLADKIIVYMNWGTEYVNYPHKNEIDLAHYLIDQGVDVIVSTQAHWVKNVEIYKGKMIFYSLGNLIFDQTHTQETSEGMILNLNYYNGELLNTQMTPILQCGYHKGAKNIANDVISGKLTYEDVDKMDDKKSCVWLQPKPLHLGHPRYKPVLDRVYEFTKI